MSVLSSITRYCVVEPPGQISDIVRYCSIVSIVKYDQVLCCRAPWSEYCVVYCVYCVLCWYCVVEPPGQRRRMPSRPAVRGCRSNTTCMAASCKDFCSMGAVTILFFLYLWLIMLQGVFFHWASP